MERAESNNNVAIEMHGVDVSAMSDPSRITVRDVNWTVRTGDYWVVGGLQGSGKSDFLLLTGGLMSPAAGTYTLFGQPMPIFEDRRLPERLRLGLVFEGGQLLNHLTVWENVALPLRYHRNLRRSEVLSEVQAVLDWMGLTTWADSTPGALGRSWQKRVGLARALILRPEVLLIDNPLGGMDVRQARWYLQFLDELSAGHLITGGRPVTLVVTAADLRPWQGHARQIAILRDDRLSVPGDWSRIEAAGREIIGELLPQEEGGGALPTT